jgi:hypothetical protein
MTTYNKNYRNVSLKTSTYDNLTEICHKIGKTKTQVLSEIITEISILCANMDDFNLEFATDLPNNLLQVILRDRKFRAVETSMPSEILKKESKFPPVEKVIK